MNLNYIRGRELDTYRDLLSQTLLLSLFHSSLLSPRVSLQATVSVALIAVTFTFLKVPATGASGSKELFPYSLETSPNLTQANVKNMIHVNYRSRQNKLGKKRKTVAPM